MGVELSVQSAGEGAGERRPLGELKASAGEVKLRPHGHEAYQACKPGATNTRGSGEDFYSRERAICICIRGKLYSKLKV